jgi:flagellar basal-body rod modification protein FlgD
MSSVTNPATAAAAPSTTSSSSSGVANTLSASDFLQILVAEFQNQDPTSPTDPTQYASQMVEFSNLGQLQSINQDLQGEQTPQTNLMQAASAFIGRQVVASGNTIGVENGSATSIAFAPTTTDSYTANVYNSSGQQVDSVSLGQLSEGSLQNFNWSPPSSQPAGLYSVQIVNSSNVALSGLLEQGTVNSVAMGSNGTVSLNIGNLVIPETQVASVAQPTAN